MVSGPVPSPSSQAQRGAVDIASEPGKERNRTNKKQFVNGCKETGAIRSGHLHPLPHKRWSPPSLPEVDVDFFFRFCCFPFCFFFFFVCFLPFFGHWCLCCFSFSFFLSFFCRRCPGVFSFFFFSFLSLGEERGGREGGGEREGWEVGAKGGRPKISRFFPLPPQMSFFLLFA